MLEAFRKLSKHFIFRLFLGVLLVAFVMSGLGGISKMHFGDDYVVKVGKRSIYKAEIDKKYDETVRNIRRSGLDFNEGQLQAMGVSKVQILRDMVQESLLRQEVDKLDLRVGDEAVLDQIKSRPEFQNEGKFDREKFNLTLAGLGISEDQFLAILHDALQINLLTATIARNVPVNDFVGDGELRILGETRDVETVRIPKDVAEFPGTPNEKELKDFYFENSYQFQVPETRDISYIILPRNKQNEASLYDSTVKIEDELAAGSSVKEIAAKFKLDTASKKGVAKDDKDFSALFMETAFGKDKGKNSDLVYDEKARQYFIIQVDNVSESRIPDLKEVQDDAVAAWKEKKANELNAKRIEEMVDELQKSGEGLQRFAGAHGYKYELVKGLKRTDTEKQGARFVGEAFAAKDHDVVGSYQNNDGSFRIAKLAAVNHGSLSDADADKFDDEFESTVNVEIMDQYLEYLRKKFPIKQSARYAEIQGNSLNKTAPKSKAK